MSVNEQYGSQDMASDRLRGSPSQLPGSVVRWSALARDAVISGERMDPLQGRHQPLDMDRRRPRHLLCVRNGRRWRGAPAEYEPPKPSYNLFIHRSRLGVFSKIFAASAGKGGKPDPLMIGATHLKAHRTAESLLMRLSAATRRTRPPSSRAAPIPQSLAKNRSMTPCANLAGRIVSTLRQHQLDLTSASTSSPRLITVS